MRALGSYSDDTFRSVLRLTWWTSLADLLDLLDHLRGSTFVTLGTMASSGSRLIVLIAAVLLIANPACCGRSLQGMGAASPRAH